MEKFAKIEKYRVQRQKQGTVYSGYLLFPLDIVKPKNTNRVVKIFAFSQPDLQMFYNVLERMKQVQRAITKKPSAGMASFV